jgi:SAM-dependent methyltransferase
MSGGALCYQSSMPKIESRPCPACGSTEAELVGESDGFQIAGCRSCRTLFTARLPESGESLDYDDYYHEGNLEVPAFVRKRLDETVAAFDGERQTGRWLDVGCGAGTLMEAVRDRGWAVVGTEVSASAAEAVRAKGLDVRAGELSALGLDDGAFDVVSMVEVVEHVPDPRGLLAQVRPLLRPGGILYVTTPHGRGVSARLLRTGWSIVAPPEHLQLFSLRGLRAALEAAGFEVASARTQAVNPSELLAALKRGRAPVEASQRVESGYRLNEALSSSSRGAALKSAANAVLSATRLGDSIRLVATNPRGAGTPRA